MKLLADKNKTTLYLRTKEQKAKAQSLLQKEPVCIFNSAHWGTNTPAYFAVYKNGKLVKSGGQEDFYDGNYKLTTLLTASQIRTQAKKKNVEIPENVQVEPDGYIHKLHRENGNVYIYC